MCSSSLQRATSASSQTSSVVEVLESEESSAEFERTILERLVNDARQIDEGLRRARILMSSSDRYEKMAAAIVQDLCMKALAILQQMSQTSSESAITNSSFSKEKTKK